MLSRGMDAVAVLLLGAALGFAQSNDAPPIVIATGKPQPQPALLLAVTQTVSETAARGGPVTFQIHVTNFSEQTIDHLLLHDSLPAGLLRVPDYEKLAHPANVSGAEAGPIREIECDLPRLTPGETKTVTLETRAVQSGRWLNRVTASAPGGWKAASQAGVLVTEAPWPAAPPALGLEIVRHDEAIDLGAESVYEIRVRNQATTAVAGLRLSASVSAGLLVLDAEGPTKVLPPLKAIVFEPLAQLPDRSDAVYRIRVKGQTAGNASLWVQVTADQMVKPLVQQVNTRVVAK
jgi:uncharacterized repeat protein (TIGR01451 family)